MFSWQRVPIFWRPLLCLSPLFQILPTQPLPALPFLLPCFLGCMGDHATSDVLFYIKLVSTIFYFFHQMKALQNLWKMFFISSKKLFLFMRFLRYLIFLSLTFHTFQINKDKRKWNNFGVMNWLAYISRCNFWKSKTKIKNQIQIKNCFILHHQTWSGNTSIIKGFFWTCFSPFF